MTYFVLSAFDRALWCPVLQARFWLAEIEALRVLLSPAADEDAELRHDYLLDDGELAAIVERFGLAFAPASHAEQRADIFLFRQGRSSAAPYLIHDGYELPLLLDGRKKLARMVRDNPASRLEGEDRFDDYVAAGLLSKEVSDDQHVYYAARGEEWRIPSMQMLLRTASKAGGWNESFERMEGTLFGYSDAENDWWIDYGLQGGGFRGVRLCLAVTQEGLAWLHAAGFRALPPATTDSVTLHLFERPIDRSMAAALLGVAEAVGVAHFGAGGRYLLSLIDLRHAGPWTVPGECLPELNQHIRGPVVMIG